MINNQIIKFLFFGLLAALVNFFARWVFNFYFPFQISIIFGHMTGMIIAFITFKNLVFQSQSYWKKEINKFIFVNLVSFLHIFIFSNLLYYFFIMSFDQATSENYSHGIAVASSALTSFILHKFFTFKKN